VTGVISVADSKGESAVTKGSSALSLATMVASVEASTGYNISNTVSLASMVGSVETSTSYKVSNTVSIAKALMSVSAASKDVYSVLKSLCTSAA
jgi:hypothetical protein